VQTTQKKQTFHRKHQTNYIVESNRIDRELIDRRTQCCYVHQEASFVASNHDKRFARNTSARRKTPFDCINTPSTNISLFDIYKKPKSINKFTHMPQSINKKCIFLQVLDLYYKVQDIHVSHQLVSYT
jgi:hypothetical protein